MIRLIYPGAASALRWQQLAALLGALLALAGWMPLHPSAKIESAPAVRQTFGRESLVISEPSSSVLPAPGATDRAYEPSSAFVPFLDIVPNGDGTGLIIQARAAGVIDASVFANVDLGPGGHKGSYTMTYSDTAQTYVTRADGFSPRSDQSGAINITTSSGLDTGKANFLRAFVPKETIPMIRSDDNNLQLNFVSAGTLAADTYIAVVRSFAPPGPAPEGHRFVSNAYSVRASNSLVVTNLPMELLLRYDTPALAEADPRTLALFAWDAFNQRWDNLGGVLFESDRSLSVATTRFTTYALMATPTWRDEFNDTSNLDLISNVRPSRGRLVLSSTPGAGTAISRPISMTVSSARWDTLVFTSTAEPPTTTLTVDVLSLDGTPLMTNVASGASLEAIDPAQYPSLKLRANLSSAGAGETPALDGWQITWQPREHRIYLPLVAR
jgi:hypothetical protein